VLSDLNFSKSYVKIYDRQKSFRLLKDILCNMQVLQKSGKDMQYFEIKNFLYKKCFI